MQNITSSVPPIKNKLIMFLTQKTMKENGKKGYEMGIKMSPNLGFFSAFVKITFVSLSLH